MKSEGPISLREVFSVPDQPRLAPGALLVSTMLTERWDRKHVFPHWGELPSWGGGRLSDCRPHWLEVRNSPSGESVGRQERENEALLHGSSTKPGVLMARLRDEAALFCSLMSRLSKC